MIKIFRAPPSYVQHVSNWHSNAVSQEDHLFPRDFEFLKELCNTRQLWLIERDESQILGTIYVTYCDGDYEIGGLYIPPEFRNLDLGTLLFVTAISDLIVTEGVGGDEQDVVLNVHDGNKGLGQYASARFSFEEHTRIEVQHSEAPQMSATSPGLVEGTTYRMRCPETIAIIINWWETWSHELTNGEAVELELIENLSLEALIDDLRGMI